jgi:hypothetical protein
MGEPGAPRTEAEESETTMRRSIWRRGTCVLGVGAFAVCTYLAPATARADDASASSTTYKETQVGQDQSVIFKDDPLAAGGFGPNDVILRVPPTPKRITLLRPRTQFISELLKTVENL